jgi:hypothetical protein
VSWRILSLRWHIIVSIIIFRPPSQGIAAGVFQGKLDQKNSHFEVDFVIGRDIRKIDIGNIVGVLSAWCDNCDTTLSTIENQVSSCRLWVSSQYLSQVEKVNKERADTIRHKAELEHRITEVKLGYNTGPTGASR